MSNFSAKSWQEQSYMLMRWRWWCLLCTRPTVGIL